MFEHFLDVKLVSNRPMYDYILSREVEDEREVAISFKLLGENVSFGWKDFDIITRLRYGSRRAVEFEHDKALRLRWLYLGDIDEYERC